MTDTMILRTLCQLTELPPHMLEPVIGDKFAMATIVSENQYNIPVSSESREDVYGGKGIHHWAVYPNEEDGLSLGEFDTLAQAQNFLFTIRKVVG